MTRLVVIGYDGSADARHAIDVAAGVLRVEAALVVNVWQGSLAAIAATGPLGAPAPPTPEEEAALEQAAMQIADEGAARARGVGVSAEAEIRRGASAEDIAATLVDVAEQHNADLVVVGRRGMSRIKELVLGSVSDAVVRDGRRPVLVVPSAGD
jgi:nucleotide-binding universal stress UspA family protein